MDREQRGLLLVEKEELEAEQQRVKSNLMRTAQDLIRLGTDLQSNPLVVHFSNAPPGLHNPPDILLMSGRPPHDLRLTTEAATSVQKLWDIRKRLGEIDQLLGAFQVVRHVESA